MIKKIILNLRGFFYIKKGEGVRFLVYSVAFSNPIFHFIKNRKKKKSLMFIKSCLSMMSIK